MDADYFSDSKIIEYFNSSDLHEVDKKDTEHNNSEAN